MQSRTTNYKASFQTRTQPSRYLIQEDQTHDKINPDFLDRKQQDQLLVSGILSSMTETILSRMVNCDTTTQIWRTLQQYFAAQNQAKVNRYKTQLQKIKKDSLGMNDFLLKIRSLVDHPTLVGHDLSPKDPIEAIFEALPSEDDTFITAINSHIDSYTIDEVESLLLSQEARIKKN